MVTWLSTVSWVIVVDVVCSVHVDTSANVVGERPRRQVLHHLNARSRWLSPPSVSTSGVYRRGGGVAITTFGQTVSFWIIFALFLLALFRN